MPSSTFPGPELPHSAKDDAALTSSTSIAQHVPPQEKRQRTPARRRPDRLVLFALSVALLVSALFAYVAVRHRDQQSPLTNIRASGIPASVSTSLANLMGLSPVPNRTAPDFALTDQKGQMLSLASFKGRAVVLEFMDPHCVDICPIVSQEFLDAYRALGTKASSVVFVAVNVNPYHLGVTDVATYSEEHQLNAIPSWHFFTGSLKDLKVVWRNYGIEVDAPSPNADIIHSSIVYFIDPHGYERYIGAPMDDHTVKGVAYLPASQLSSWGEGIALVTRQLVG